MLFAFVLRNRQIIFNAFQIATICLNISSHRHFCVIHIMQIDFFLFRVCQRFCLSSCLSSFKCNRFPKITIFVCWHHVWIKAQNILITDAVRNAVPVQLIAEHIRSSAHFLLIFIVDRRAGKAKKHGVRESLFNSPQHFAKHITMSFINDKYNPFILNQFDVVRIEAIFFFHTAHFLNRCDNQRVCGIIAPQFCYENIRVFCSLHRVCIVGKPAIVQQGLRAKFNSVHQEYNLVGILGSCNQLSRFEAGQCFSGTGGVPDVAAHLIPISPSAHSNAAGNTRSRIILIAAHNLQNTVGIVGNGIEADQLVCHRDGKQILCKIFCVMVSSALETFRSIIFSISSPSRYVSKSANAD